jgi:GTPase SAR1 family protein
MERLGRADLASRAAAAASRLGRTSTVVCVVGEYKQGKSSLVNGLLGRDVCPVDDDLATSAITIVRYAEQATATVVRRSEDGAAVTEPVELDALAEWVTEQGNPRNGRRVELVEVGVPSAVLSEGLILVDTPGMGGLGAGHAAVTLGFLPFADGLILVSDASAELSAPELDLLRRACELCPTVLVVTTKTDLYPAWERIRALDREHLRRVGLDLPSVAVSSVVRAEALRRRDRQLNERSRFPELISELLTNVIDPAREGATERAAAEGRRIAALVRDSLEAERSLLQEGADHAAELAQLETAKARLDHLRGPGARWSVVVNDRIADLSTAVTHGLRAAIRATSREMDERIETLRRGDEWDAMVRDLQTQTAEAVTAAFVALEEGRGEIRRAVAELLDAEVREIAPTATASVGFDLEGLGLPGELPDVGKLSGRRALRSSLSGLKGAQGGILMFGMMSQFLPAAVATLVLANPVLLGIGAVFGGVGLAEERKRRALQQRQAARTQVRQFLDDVQFEVGNQLATAVRELQRDLRDEFTELLTELQTTWTDVAQRAQENAHRTQQQRQHRAAELDAAITALEQVERSLRTEG